MPQLWCVALLLAASTAHASVTVETRPVTLAEIKADKRFAKFPLTYLPRLSVMPVADAEWSAIVKLSERPAAAS